MPVPKFSPNQIVGVDVFLERFQTRVYVGMLRQEKNKFTFSYDKTYLNMKNILPLGPEFPLTCQDFHSYKLFPSFLDRLPDPESPSCADDCTHVGLAITTTNPIVLLARFKRGPSSFIFEPIYENKYSYKHIEKLKDNLGLSLQDVAYLFDISLSSLQKIKTGDTPGNEILRQIELYLEVPEALEFQIQRNAKYLHPEKVKKALEFLNKGKAEKKLIAKIWNILSYAELDFIQECLKKLQSCNWAQNLIKKINLLGFLPSSMPILFEIRFAYALYKTRLLVESEYKTGVGDTDVDFLVTETNGTKWFIELTSLDESLEVKNNTVVKGNTFEFSSKITSEDKENTHEPMSLMRVQRAILSKVAKNNDKKGSIPTKFPIPKSGEYNIIIIDMRGFVIGSSDQWDYQIILNGNASVPDECKRYFIDPNTKEQKPIIGLFESIEKQPFDKCKSVQYLQERIHGVGFVRENHYVDGELQTIIELFPNPKLFNEAKELREIFPLKQDKNYNPASNPYRYSPPLDD